LTDEIDIETIEDEEADNKHCKEEEEEEEGAMQEAIQETRLSEQDTSDKDALNDFI
jgi:hypothetical protein